MASVATSMLVGGAALAAEGSLGSPVKSNGCMRLAAKTPPKVAPQRSHSLAASAVLAAAAGVVEIEKEKEQPKEQPKEVAIGEEADVEDAPPAARKRMQPGLPRHRLAGKTPKGLAGRVAELVCARTTDSAGDLPGAALAECILQVTGPPQVTRAAAKARHLLTWLRRHTKRGSTRVCGRTISAADVEEASTLVGDVWSKKLIKLQRRGSKAKARSVKRTDADGDGKSPDGGASKEALKGAEVPKAKPKKEVIPGEEVSSDGESDDHDSDLSGEEEVDSEDEDMQEHGPDDFVDPAPALREDGYRGDWTGAPPLGSPSFNDFAAAAMKKAGVACAFPTAAFDKSVGCPPLQPHQEAAMFLLHPKSPVTRLLVDHPTGSGKTREMIEVLDNFFHDPRPKVPIFPKEPVCRNFYAELLRWPSKYRDYFCCLRPHSAARAARTRDWRASRSNFWDISSLGDKELRGICKEMCEVLEMKGCFYMGRMRRFWRDDFKNRFPDMPLPAAPLRALRYTSAGGRHTALREEDGLPISALFKIGFSKEDPNVYSNKIIIMDEVHNLVRSQTQFGEQLTHLRSLLMNAKGATLAGFTGTPILSEPHEGRQLLEIIKGFGAPAGDAGFISSFPMRPKTLFPQSLPRGIPDAVLSPNLRREFVKKVPLCGEALQRYDKKRATGLPMRRLQRYCNLCVHFGAMHEGKHGCKNRVLESLETCAPKLHAIAKDVAADPSKAVVLVARSSGMDALIQHLRQLAKPAGDGQCFGVATMDELAAFNSPANTRGELYRVLVADSTQCGEGVSFFTVRSVLLADVPANPSALVQAVGRSIRMYGHHGLPADEWTVTTRLYAATLPRWLQSPLGTWAYRAQRHYTDPKVAQRKARRLVRKLVKVGVPSLDVLRERLLAHFPEVEQERQAAQSPVDREQAANTNAPDVAACGNQESSSDLPLSQGSEGSRSSSSDAETLLQHAPSSSQLSTSDDAPAHMEEVKMQEADAEPKPQSTNAPAAKQLNSEELVKFVQSLGLWEEAKSMEMAKQQGDNKAKKVMPALKRRPSQAEVRDPKKSAGRPPQSSGQSQHYLERALSWVANADSVQQLVESMNLNPRTADEEALQHLAEASRAMVPALRELRDVAIDRTALETLIASQADQLASQVVESDGESSACDFGVSDASSGGEEAGPAPLVLPPGWRSEKVRRGKGIIREFVDPSGRRFKTEAQAHRAVDTLRRAANLAVRFRQRFSERMAASASLAAIAASVGTAEGSEAKRPRIVD